LRLFFGLIPLKNLVNGMFQLFFGRLIWQLIGSFPRPPRCVLKTVFLGIGPCFPFFLGKVPALFTVSLSSI